MIGSLAGLAMAALVFVASHFALSHPPVRKRLVAGLIPPCGDRSLAAASLNKFQGAKSAI